MPKQVATLPPEPSRAIFDKMVRNLNKIRREHRASALIWHVYLEFLIDWLLRKQKGSSEKLIKEGTFYHKVMALEVFAVLPKDIIANLYAINTVRNFYAHEIDTQSHAFNEKCRMVFRVLDAYKNSSLKQKYKTPLLYSTIANECYHELHKLYFKL